MLQSAYVLDPEGRSVVLKALREHSFHRGWNLLAAHIRSNHIHAVVEAEALPERIMNEFKAYASRALNRRGVEDCERKRWARHGSTRWLWHERDVDDAIKYLAERQGEPMALFVAYEP